MAGYPRTLDADPKMHRRCKLRASPMNCFGPVLAAIALLLQIALPALHPPVPLGSAGGLGKFSGAFDEHALCLAPDPGDARTPADQAPKPVHHEFAACCFWHGNAALAVAPAAPLESVAFASSSIVFTPFRQIVRPRLTGAVGARAPPARA